MKIIAAIFTLCSATWLDAASPVFDFEADMRFSHLPTGSQDFLHTVPVSSECYYTNVYSKTVTTGDNTVYTVPSGMRFLSMRCQVRALTNSTVVTPEVSTNSVVYPVSSSQTVTTNGTTLSFRSLVFESGESVNINTTGPLPSVNLNGLVFTNTYGLKSPRVYPASGNNTVYTVPVNRHAICYNTPGGGVDLHCQYCNGSVSTVAMIWYCVPNGEAVGPETIVSGSTASPGATTGTASVGIPVLFPGDSVVINVDSSSAGQIAWTTILETQ